MNDESTESTDYADWFLGFSCQWTCCAKKMIDYFSNGLKLPTSSRSGKPGRGKSKTHTVPKCFRFKSFARNIQSTFQIFQRWCCYDFNIPIYSNEATYNIPKSTISFYWAGGKKNTCPTMPFSFTHPIVISQTWHFYTWLSFILFHQYIYRLYGLSFFWYNSRSRTYHTFLLFSLCSTCKCNTEVSISLSGWCNLTSIDLFCLKSEPTRTCSKHKSIQKLTERSNT